MSSDFSVHVLNSRVIISPLNHRRASVHAIFDSAYAATIFIETIMNDGYIFEEIEASPHQSFRGEVLVGRDGVATAGAPVQDPPRAWTWNNEPIQDRWATATEQVQRSRRFDSGPREASAFHQILGTHRGESRAAELIRARDRNHEGTNWFHDQLQAYLDGIGGIMPPHGLPPLDSGDAPEADAGDSAS